MLRSKCDDQPHVELRDTKALQNDLQVQTAGIKFSHFSDAIEE